MYTWVSMCSYVHMSMEKRWPVVEVTGSCEPPDMGARTLSQNRLSLNSCH